MLWLRVGVGVVLLLWVLGVGYFQARRRGRRVGPALTLLAAGLLSFVVAAFSPRPPMTAEAARALVILSVVLLALSVTVVLARGFRS